MSSDDGWDDDDADLLPGDDEPGGTGLDALGRYGPVAAKESGPVALFTVTNPSGTLSATAAIGGRLQHVDVMDVSRLDEARLADEILELATLAKEKAQAAQHEVVVELMRQLGHDRAGTRAFLTHSIGLPSIETVNARLAEAFANHYRSDD